mmetsp:Transcript_11278/g.31981  ORF Transcript_11278/g.31981 Transcript_11278/m.31981 type:complete len:294 (+) Transcript_11278:1179-2060(+)
MFALQFVFVVLVPQGQVDVVDVAGVGKLDVGAVPLVKGLSAGQLLHLPGAVPPQKVQSVAEVGVPRGFPEGLLDGRGIFQHLVEMLRHLLVGFAVQLCAILQQQLALLTYLRQRDVELPGKNGQGVPVRPCDDGAAEVRVSGGPDDTATCHSHSLDSAAHRLPPLHDYHVVPSREELPCSCKACQPSPNNYNIVLPDERLLRRHLPHDVGGHAKVDVAVVCEEPPRQLHQVLVAVLNVLPSCFHIKPLVDVRPPPGQHMVPDLCVSIRIYAGRQLELLLRSQNVRMDARCVGH